VTYRICVVCTGNICRSPMLEFLLREALDDAGLADRVSVDSAGVSAEEAGNRADSRTLAVLARQGHDDWGGRAHRARRIERSWLDERDLVLAADAGHLWALHRLAGDRHTDHIRLIRSFDPDAVAAGDLDVDDPWYGSTAAFDRTYAELRAAVPGILAHVRAALDA
jgi:protein-tyrosine phosphatase